MYLFAYGTLQPGSNLKYFEENALSKFLTPIGKGEVRGTLTHLKNTKLGIEYPGMTVAEGVHTVRGTVFEVEQPTEAFKIMDAHELYTSEPGTHELTQIDLFKRQGVQVMLNAGGTCTAVAYVLNPDSKFMDSGAIQKLGTVDSGDWLSYIKS